MNPVQLPALKGIWREKRYGYIIKKTSSLPKKHKGALKS